MVSTISVRLRKWSDFLFLYLRRLTIAAWRISLFVRLAQRYALYLLAVEQPAAGTMEVLIALGDVDRYVEHDGGRLGQAVGVGSLVKYQTGQQHGKNKHQTVLRHFESPLLCWRRRIMFSSFRAVISFSS